ncbi:ribbon-helix-helix domain-containing protein [Jannaschia pohangensis]|uniref:Ribbon-helix-helix protein, copG family n=1 Tax=Jannaschia pohangensis TaxID=390807 RepID=A0A1I3UAA2_9RHOB|nr:ribbon-helix-helix domain-containing protein [Jannaschia pohangensis]SFJ78707.1 hypothetical protein SAMN04488095_3652 [Jannaschia pohangensis]
METRDVTIRMPLEMAAAIERLAQRFDVTPGQVVRRAVCEELKRRSKPPKTPNRADEGLVASLQSLLAPDMAEARSWPDLEARLSRRGYRLSAAGGGCALFTTTGRRLCKGSELGFTYRQLVRRFGAAMPGHPHGAVGLTDPEGDPLLD